MASKRHLEGASSTQSSKQAKIDLNYPISTTSSSTSITPPFIQPPFNASNGELSLSVAQPLSINGGSIVLNSDETLETVQGKLSVNVDPEGPIITGTNGLNLMLGKGITEDEFHHLTLNISPDQPLDLSSSGLSVLFDSQSLTTSNSSVNAQYELMVNLEPDGGLEKSDSGISIKTDTTLTTDDTGLGVVLNPDGPITADENGIDIDVDPDTILIKKINNENAISVNLDVGSCLIASSSGIAIKTDNTLQVSNNTLGVVSNNSTYTITSGSQGLSNYNTAQVMAKISNSYINLPCAYYAKIFGNGSVVNGYITMNLRTVDMTAVPTEYQTITPTFTFWLCRDLENDSQFNFSRCTNNSYTENSKQNTIPSTYNSFITGINSSNCYLSSGGGVTLYGRTEGELDLANRYNYTCTFSLVKLSSNSNPQLAFTISLTTLTSNSKYLYDTSSNGNVTIGPIFFSYFSN